MKRTTILWLLLFINSISFGQTYLMENGNNGTITTCGGTFYDKGGASGNYWSNQDGTITFCPATPGTKIRLSFTSFNTQGSQGNCTDFLALWHGSSTVINPNIADAVYCDNLPPFVVTSTAPDGCLTLRFVSNNAVNRAGWAATISCARPCTAPIASFTDASTVNICASNSTNPSNNTISFNAGASYSPSGDSITKYIWQWGDGTTTTTTTPITTHPYTNVGIYVVKLKVRDSNYDFDAQGCLSDVTATKTVRVLPATTLPTDTNNFNIACGNTVTLNGSASSQTLTEIPLAPFITPITISNNNPSGYTSTVDYTGFFPAGATLQPGCYPTVTFNLEHSFSADLTIDLMAPNGQIVRLFNRSRAGGPPLSGVNFGTCANNNDDGVPGCGAQYTVVNSGGASWDSTASRTTASASCPGFAGPCNGIYYYIAQTYTSATPFTALNGTPLNGTWKLIINDLQAFDDGILFGWSLTFPNSCYAPLQSVTPAVTSLNWAHTGTGPTVPTQTTTSTSITDPGPGSCPVPGTCVGNTLSNNVTIGPFNSTGTYVYTLTATNQFGCQYTRNYTVNVTCASCLLTLSSAANTLNQSRCVGNAIANVIYNVSGNPTTVNVSGLPSGVTATYNAGILTISGTPTTAGVYNYVISTVGCTPNSTASGTITITAPANARTISGNTALCAGTTSNLTASVNNGTWASSNTAVATVSNTGLVTAIAAGTATITYTVAGNGGCANATANATITVTAPANAGTISGNTALCAGTTSNLTASVNGGTWASSNTAVATVSNTGLVTAIAAGTATITYTVAGNGGCANATANATITVTAPANAGTISGNTALCAGTTSNLTASVNGGTWASSNTAVATVSNTGLVTAIAAGTATITYTVAGNGGCANATANATITVTAPANAGTISGNTALCAGTTSNLTASVNNGTWASSNTAVATVSNTGLVTAIAAGTATITYTVAGNGGCANATANATITVTAPANAGTISGNTALCAGTTSNLTASVNGGTWASSNTAVATVSNTGLVTAIAAGTATITYTVAGNGGCANATANATITVTAPANAGTISGNTALCAGTTSNLTASVNGGTWASSNTAVATVSNTGLVTAIAAGTATITYTVAGNGGCANATANTTITVTANSILNAIDDTVITYPNSIVATILNNDTLNGNPINLSQVSISLISSSNNNITLNTSNGIINIGSTVSSGTYTLVYQLCNNGCGAPCDIATVTITVNNLFNIEPKSSYVFACHSTNTMTSYDSLFDGVTIGGIPASSSNAVINLTSNLGITANANGTVNVPTGIVNVNQCPYTLTFTYTICSGSICTPPMTGYVKLSASLIAEDDRFNFKASGTTCDDPYSVLLNDIYNPCNNGQTRPENYPVDFSNVTLTQLSCNNSDFVLNTTTGIVEYVGPSNANMPPAVYELTYQICSIDNPSICAIGLVYIVTECSSFNKQDVENKDLAFDVVIAPNPSNGIFEVNLPKVTDEVSFEIINTLGQKVYSDSAVNSSLHQMQITHLPSGTYYLKISSNNQSVTKKIVKQ